MDISDQYNKTNGILLELLKYNSHFKDVYEE